MPTPEQIAERRELQRWIVRTLAGLPAAWRRAFTLHAIAGLSPADIARLTGRAEADVARDLEHARHYLAERLREAGLAPDRETVDLFRTSADVEVPAGFRGALEEHIRQQEEAGAPAER
jgi:hypothetical protein